MASLRLIREQREVELPKLSIIPSHIIRPGYCLRCGLPMMIDREVLTLLNLGWYHYEC
jgi:hypothetical protein